jgi:acyl carrier protein phosphodiesterase
LNIPRELQGINSDLEKAVAFFRPILKELDIKNHASIGKPVLLGSVLFPNLKEVKSIRKWTITILKTDLIDSRAKFISQYDRASGIMQNYIILDKVLYVEAKVPNITRKAVAVHEFCHFLALLYACITVSEGIFQEILKNRLSKIVDVLTNEQTLKLYRLLNKVRQFSDEFASFEQTRDDHFRLYCEDLELSYTDLFRNFLLSRQLFDEYFINHDKEVFYNLLRGGQTQDALDLYFNIASTIAEEKWLSKEFADSQAINILMKFYINEIYN